MCESSTLTTMERHTPDIMAAAGERTWWSSCVFLGVELQEFHSTFDSVHCASLWSDRSSGSIWHHNASQEAVQCCEMAKQQQQLRIKSSSMSWHVQKQNLRSLEEDFLLFLKESWVVQSNSTCSSANQTTAHLEPIEDLCYLIYLMLVNPSLALFETWSSLLGKHCQIVNCHEILFIHTQM